MLSCAMKGRAMTRRPPTWRSRTGPDCFEPCSVPVIIKPVVRRVAIAFLLTGILFAQDDPQLKKRSPDQSKPEQQQDQEPPEEDESIKPKTYSFNPLEAEKDLKVGFYYF